MDDGQLRTRWGKCRLGSIVERLTNGYVGPTRDIYLENGTPYLLARHVKNNHLTFDGKTFISERFNQKNKKSILKTGDVLLVQSGHIGHSAVVPENHKGHNCHAMIVISPSKARLTGKFLSYYFNSSEMQDQFEGIRTGSTIPHLNCRDVKEIQIPLPPLPEQKRIVTILDEAFAAISQAVAHAEKNLANARELFESYLNKVFTQNGEGWVKKSINDVAAVISGYSFKSNDFSERNATKSIKITNVGVGSFVTEKYSFLPSKFLEKYEKFKIPKGSIVIALTRSIISNGLKVAVVPSDYDGALLNQRVAALISRPSIILNQYLFFFLCSAGVAAYVKKKANTLMQPNLSINDLKNLFVPIPPFTEQEQRLQRLTSIIESTQHLETIYQQKLTALDELKQSILQKAFTGELTADTAQQQVNT